MTENSFAGGILNGLAVPMGLGLLRLTTRGRPSDIDAFTVIKLALNQGIRVLDTADVYCLGEEDLHYGEHLVRQALRSWRGPKRDVRVLTKAGLSRPGGQWVPNGRPEHLRQSVENSLRALGVEQLFLLQLHVRDPGVNFDETLGALAELQAAGKVEHLGLCNVTVDEVRQAQQYFSVASVQNELSILNRSSAHDGMLQLTQASGIPFLAHRPLGGYAKTENISRDPVLAAIAQRHGATPHEIALSALRSAGSHILPLIGATRVGSVRSSLRALELTLDVSDRTALAAHYSFDASPVVEQLADSLATPARRASEGADDAPSLARRAGVTGESTHAAAAPPRGPSTEPEVVIVMGIQGAGKSVSVSSYVDAGYARLNRDQQGGSLNDLIPRLRQLLASGKTRVVLDNTYPSRASRAPVIAAAQQYRIPVRCLFLQTPVAEARINVVLRMLSKYGLPLGPNEMQSYAKADPNLPPPQALSRWMSSFESPSAAEGFTAVEVMAFARQHDPEHTQKGLLLDVDGTLRRTRSGEIYPRHPDDVELLPGRQETLREWVDDGYQLFFVSNQSGVASGRVSLDAVRGAFMRTAELLALPVTEIAYCPHPSRPVGCFCRKPLPGLGVYLAWKHRLDMQQLVMVGDMDSDREFASGLGIRYVDEGSFFA